MALALGEIVVNYSEVSEGRLSEIKGHKSYALAEDFWVPTSNVWHCSSIASQSIAKGMDANQIRRAEHRLAAAADLAEREAHHRAQARLAELDEGGGAHCVH